jgi:hypothetical protein
MAAGKTILGACLEFESAHFWPLIQITEGAQNADWSELLVLVRIPPQVTGAAREDAGG